MISRKLAVLILLLPDFFACKDDSDINECWVEVNGEQAGYRVYPGRDRQQFAALGLRPGDLIMDIDGQALSDPTQAMQIFQSLGTAEQVTVTVERTGHVEPTRSHPGSHYIFRVAFEIDKPKAGENSIEIGHTRPAGDFDQQSFAVL